MEAGTERGRQLKLTRCELEVFRHLLSGETNKEIAQRLRCSTKNVEFHVSNILRKAGQPSRVRLVASMATFPREVQVGSDVDRY
jgi:DNA-binding NarL/FixJ family response regulator